MENKCKHKRIKRNYPFGRKSAPRRFCKDCGKPISSRQLNKDKKQKEKKK